jgi:hypothetical protein
MKQLGMYTTPESGPLSWGAVRRDVKAVSDSDFRKRAGFKKGKGLLAKIADAFTSARVSAPASLQRPGFISGLGDEITSPTETAKELLQETKTQFTKLLLMFTALGLAGYVYWRFF